MEESIRKAIEEYRTKYRHSFIRTLDEKRTKISEYVIDGQTLGKPGEFFLVWVKDNDYKEGKLFVESFPAPPKESNDILYKLSASQAARCQVEANFRKHYASS